MARNQNISWNVQNADLAKSPLGYQVEICEDALVSKVLSTHNTFEKTNEFEVSMRGNDVFVPYPTAGVIGATTKTVVRMLRNGETPKSVLLVANGSALYKMSLDCSTILIEKEICESGTYFIDSISCDKSGKIWVKDSGGVMTVLNQDFNVLNMFRTASGCIFSVVDPLRRLLWQITSSTVILSRTNDMSVVFSYSLPVSVYSITEWDISGPSGTLFLTCDSSVALSITTQGAMASFSSGATGICQWGSKGALVCKPNAIDYFDGTSVTDTYSGSLVGISNPERISSLGHGYFVVSDSTGLIAKVDEDMSPKWFVKYNQLVVYTDVKVTPSPTDLGGIIYLCSSEGVASYRDMTDEGLNYGSTLVTLSLGRSPSNYPVTAVVPDLTTSHVWSSITAISGGGSGVGIMEIGDDFVIN
jgi:hypothetical protein